MLKIMHSFLLESSCRTVVFGERIKEDKVNFHKRQSFEVVLLQTFLNTGSRTLLCIIRTLSLFSI